MGERVTVMIVDDDDDIRDLLQDYLGDNGYEVLAAASGAAMRGLLQERVPDVVLLDVALPGEDGLSLARHVREQFDIGIIMVSGAGETVDRIVGLEVGADDYVAKPFDLRELRARLKSVARRYQREPGSNAASVDVATGPATRRVAVGAAVLDLDTAQLFDGSGAELPLTAAEFELLRAFVERPNRPLSRDQLMNLTQNRDWDPYDRSIDIRIARLRKKIEADPDKPRAIRTKRGLGYMFVPRPSGE
ncbi:MAG: response regulator [Gammaproteobacteria bacterium]|nr:response regulator [Gammaproteobacteria bacterium]MCP5200182.1 response regulator [Gammaproteobacteria bacterium]